MAKTAYQKQADARTKTALRLRARFDVRLRKYARQVLDALVGAADAKARLDRINLLYGVDISTETLLVQAVRNSELGMQLSNLLTDSAPGEEVQLFNPTVNANGGVILDGEAVFGEPVPVGSVPPSTPTNGGVTAAISVSKLQAVRVNETTWNVVVQANAPSGTYHLSNDNTPYEYDFKNGDEQSLSFFNMQVGLSITFSFTDSVNRQVTLQRTLVLE